MSTRRPARRTRIVATVGPASARGPVLRRMLAAGVDAVRLNFSHGTHAEHASYISAVRAIESELERPICILQDLCGPKLRVGSLSVPITTLRRGDEITLDPSAAGGEGTHIPVSVPNLAGFVHPGQRILLDDGRLELRVLRVRGETVVCRVVVGGVLLGHKGINLPGCRLPMSGMTEKDWEDLAFGVSQGVDAVAVSFVETAEDIRCVQDRIRTLGGTQPVIAKIERAGAVANLDAIIRQAAGVMVARGDMAVELSPERVPLIQKRIIDAAQAHGKVVITATQMLESMIHDVRPTRAEASDVANAVLDGTDCLMLSAETASGAHPVEAVRTMARIARETERLPETSRAASLERLPDISRLVAHGACELADQLGAAAIVVFSRSGTTAVQTSKCRPTTPVIAVTPDVSVRRRLCLAFGLETALLPDDPDATATVLATEAELIERGRIAPGDTVVVVYGQLMGAPGTTNTITVHTLA